MVGEMERGLPASIGIIGGVGPWVDPLLLRKILAYQANLGLRRDQDTIPVVLAQHGAMIGDRTAYLASLDQGEEAESPAVTAARVARSLAAQGARVLGIPCNTFHVHVIFDRFRQEIADLETIDVVNLVETAIDDLVRRFPTARRAGILSTNGSYLRRLFADPIRARGLEPVTLPFDSGPPPRQVDVHEAIYGGIKSGQEADRGYPGVRGLLREAVGALSRRGAEVVVLGCTELPLAISPADVSLPLLDPLDSLARGLVDRYIALGLLPECLHFIQGSRTQ